MNAQQVQAHRRLLWEVIAQAIADACIQPTIDEPPIASPLALSAMAFLHDSPRMGQFCVLLDLDRQRFTERLFDQMHRVESVESNSSAEHEQANKEAAKARAKLANESRIAADKAHLALYGKRRKPRPAQRENTLIAPYAPPSEIGYSPTKREAYVSNYIAYRRTVVAREKLQSAVQQAASCA